jgi:hypothetical protein
VVLLELLVPHVLLLPPPLLSLLALQQLLRLLLLLALLRASCAGRLTRTVPGTLRGDGSISSLRCPSGAQPHTRRDHVVQQGCVTCHSSAAGNDGFRAMVILYAASILVAPLCAWLRSATETSVLHRKYWILTPLFVAENPPRTHTYG